MKLKLLIVILFLVSCSDERYEDKIIYYKYCNKVEITNIKNCQNNKIEYTYDIYRISFDKQIVITKSTLGIDILKHCTVFDKNNWACDKISVINGRYYTNRGNMWKYQTSYFEFIRNKYLN